MARPLTVYNWMVGWNPHPELEHCYKPVGAVEVGLFPDKTRWTDRYEFTDGCCMLDWKPEDRVQQMFIVFHTLVVRDGIDPQRAHREFLKIAEYRRKISADIEGADGNDWLSNKSMF